MLLIFIITNMKEMQAKILKLTPGEKSVLRCIKEINKIL